MSLEKIIQIHERETQHAGFAVVKTDELTLVQILSLYQSGVPVVRTPHVGNMSDGNLTVAGLGLPLVVLDHNTLDRDDIYHPAHLVRDATDTPLSIKTPGKITRYALTFTGDSLLALHMLALRKVFQRNENIHTFADSLQSHDNIGLIADIVAVAIREFPDLFKRQLDSSGIAKPIPPHQLHRVFSDSGIYPINGDRQGVMIPNELTIILDALLSALDSGNSLLIELTGRQMYDYVDSGYAQKLATIYARLRSKLPSLPSDVTLALVPTAAARATIGLRYSSEMNEVFTAYEALVRGEKFVNAFKGMLISQSKDKQAMIALLSDPAKTMQKKAKDRFKNSVKALPQIFSPFYHQRVTQHDLESGFHICEVALTMTMKELSLMMKLADKLFLEP